MGSEYARSGRTRRYRTRPLKKDSRTEELHGEKQIIQISRTDLVKQVELDLNRFTSINTNKIGILELKKL